MSTACFLSLWSGLRRAAVCGLGGATVMDSLTPKFQVTGDPGLERILLGTSPTTSWRITDWWAKGYKLDTSYLVLGWFIWWCRVYRYWSYLLDQVTVVEAERFYRLLCLNCKKRVPLLFLVYLFSVCIISIPMWKICNNSWRFNIIDGIGRVHSCFSWLNLATNNSISNQRK